VAKVPEGADHHDLNVVARRVLLDALVALQDQSEALTIVGAQAIYLRSPQGSCKVVNGRSELPIHRW
jgi:hypothetical protein